MNYKSPYPFLAIVFLFLVVTSNEFEINRQDLFDNSSGNSTYNDQQLPYPSIINYNQINAPGIYIAKKKKKMQKLILWITSHLILSLSFLLAVTNNEL